MKLSEIMTKNPQAIDPRETVGQAFHAMTLGGIRHLPVVERGRLIGIVTDRDLRAYAGSPEVLVGWIMTTEPKVGKPDEDAREVARRMAEMKIGCLPVVDEVGGVVGIVTIVDILTGFAKLRDSGPPAPAA